MLFSYLDHMTGFYLCFSYLSILLTIFSPITVILQVFNGAFLSQCDELTVFNSSHIFSLDSVCIMGSCVNNGEPIFSLLSVYRPRANCIVRNCIVITLVLSGSSILLQYQLV